MIEYIVNVYKDGTNEWFLDGQLHREDGPAIEYVSGTKEWWLKGKLHREDGPAVEWADGSKELHLNDKRITEEEFNNRMNPDPCDGKVVEIEGRKYKLQPV